MSFLDIAVLEPGILARKRMDENGPSPLEAPHDCDGGLVLAVSATIRTSHQSYSG
jgi:hypothetical protein